MNSFTSSSESYRHYVLWLLVCAGVPIAILFVIGIHLQPLFGDLTRLGFYAEHDFGWQDVQYTFPQPLLHVDAELADLRQPVDILVIGDSFSRVRPEYQWQNYVIARHPLSMLTMDINHIDIRQVINNPHYLQHPPHVLIVESVERQLPLRLTDNVPDCPSSRQIKSPTLHALGKDTVGRPPLAQARNTSWNLININFVLKYLEHQVKFTPNLTPSVYALSLNNGRLFSNKRADTLLVLGDDVRRPEWKAQDLSGLSCRIESLRQRVEARGTTRFVLMIAPDKLTAYAPWLTSHSLQKSSQLASLSAQHPETMPRLDLALKQAIAAGQRDVYFPDDTHWGWKGQQIAAITLMRFLDQELQALPPYLPTAISSSPTKYPSTPKT